MSKKLLSMLAIAAISIGVLAGCGGSDSGEKAAPAEKTTSTENTDNSTADAKEESSENTEEDTQDGGNVIQVPVTIVNNTDVEIHELYTSGAGVDEWGDDILGGQVLAPGTQVEDLVFNIDADNVKWDLLAKDEVGDSLEFYGLDLSECSTDGITVSLTYDRDTQTGTITAE